MHLLLFGGEGKNRIHLNELLFFALDKYSVMG